MCLSDLHLQCIYPSIPPFIYLFVCPLIYQSIYLSIYPFTIYLSIYLSIYEQDVLFWMKDKQEVEIVDFLLQVKQCIVSENI